MLKTITTVLLIIATYLILSLGLDYVELGYGLHPVIAVLLAAMISVTIIFMWAEAFTLTTTRPRLHQGIVQD